MTVLQAWDRFLDIGLVHSPYLPSTRMAGLEVKNEQDE